jgi:hypothetical protein
VNPNKRESMRAIRLAKHFARDGNRSWAQVYINRAAQFWPVSKGTITTINRLLREARDRLGVEQHEEFAKLGY